MEFERARERLLALKGQITGLLLEARVPVNHAEQFLLDAWVDVREIEWTNRETTDRLLLESIDRQCWDHAAMMGRPYRGLQQELKRSARR